MRNRMARLGTAALCVGASVLLATDLAQARPTRIDFGSDPDDFVLTGALWPDAFLDGVDLTNNGTTSGALPFDLLIGTTSYTNYCMVENGFVQFSTIANPCAPGAADPLAVFTVLGDAWLSVFDGSATTLGTTSVSLDGVVDRNLDGGDFELADAQDAVRFLWNAVTLEPGGVEFTFQMLLFDLGAGNFDVEFNYGSPGDFLAAYNVGQQRITTHDGGELLLGQQPFLSATNYDFSFRNGVLGEGPDPTPVPEPGSLSLLTLAIGGLLLVKRRRRRAV